MSSETRASPEICWKLPRFRSTQTVVCECFNQRDLVKFNRILLPDQFVLARASPDTPPLIPSCFFFIYARLVPRATKGQILFPFPLSRIFPLAHFRRPKLGVFHRRVISALSRARCVMQILKNIRVTRYGLRRDQRRVPHVISRKRISKEIR